MCWFPLETAKQTTLQGALCKLTNCSNFNQGLIEERNTAAGLTSWSTRPGTVGILWSNCKWWDSGDSNHRHFECANFVEMVSQWYVAPVRHDPRTVHDRPRFVNCRSIVLENILFHSVDVSPSVSVGWVCFLKTTSYEFEKKHQIIIPIPIWVNLSNSARVTGEWLQNCGLASPIKSSSINTWIRSNSDSMFRPKQVPEERSCVDILPAKCREP